MSIDKLALCIGCFLSQTKMRKQDKPTTLMVHELKHAAPGSGKYWKELYSRPIRMKVETPSNTLRTFIRERTHEWIPGLLRIYPTTLYEVDELVLAKLKQDVELSHTDFKDNFDQYKEEGRLHLGDMYNEHDYPSVAILKTQFKVKIEIKPVPIQVPSNHISRLFDESQEVDMEELKKIFEASEKENLQIVTLSCARKVYEKVSPIVERMTARRKPVKNGKANTYRDSLIGNVWDLVQILPELNLADSPEINDLHIALKSNLLSQLNLDDTEPIQIEQKLKESMKNLRENPSLENSVKKEAESIMAMAESILPSNDENI